MLNQWDNAVFYFINQGCGRSFFDGLMLVATCLGSTEFLLFVAIGALFFMKKEIRKFGFLLLLGLFASTELVTALKVWFARPRPFLVLPHVHLFLPESGFSFPSGHTTNAFFVATLIFFTAKRPFIFYALAILVGISRIYLGLHFPSDVVGGVVLGMFLGFAVKRVSSLIAS